MTTRFLKRTLSLILAICMVLSALTVTAFAETATWKPADSTQIYVDANAVGYFSYLQYEAIFFQGEYEENLGQVLPVATGAVSKAGSNDVILTYDAAIPAGGYKLSISETCLTVAASDDEGMFYGYRAVISQMLTAGVVVDTVETPDVGEDAPSVDMTALEAAVALAPKVEARKELIVGGYYENYMSLIEEAKTYYLGQDNFDQATVDAMTNTIMTLYDELVDGTHDVAVVLAELNKRFANYEKVCILHKANPFPLEAWIYYNAAITRAKNLVATNAYDRDSVTAAVADIEYAYYGIYYAYKLGVTEADMVREDMINSAGFQTKTAYSGGAVRLSVNTIREFDVTNLLIMDENGLEVSLINITAAPVNRRKPNEKILYADIMLDLEPGTYTFTIYAFQGNTARLCGDPVQCTITVK